MMMDGIRYFKASMCFPQEPINQKSIESLKRLIMIVDPFEDDKRLRQKTTLTRINDQSIENEQLWEELNFTQKNVITIPGTGKTFFWKCEFKNNEQILNDELLEILTKIKNIRIDLPSDSNIYQYQFKINISNVPHMGWYITILLDITAVVSFTVNYVMEK